MNRVKKGFAILSIMGVVLAIGLHRSDLAQAANMWCTGTVGGYHIDVSGALMIAGSWRGDSTQVCNVAESWKGVEPATCMAWFTMLAKARDSSTSVTLMYSDNAAPCNALPTYSSSPAPFYVGRL